MSRPHLKELLSKKEVDPAKEDTLEKGDFLALLTAAVSVFFPILLAAIAVLALFIFLFVTYFH